MYKVTTALKKLSKLQKRIRGIQGGTSASKTISIIQLLIDQCQRDKTPQLTSITSESIPHLKRGAIRDFKNIMQDHHYWDDKRWNATDFIYTFETGTPLEFFSLDMPHKVRGPRRKRLFINEANNIPKETFDQLEVRTEDVIWLDWNPVSEFWWHTDIVPNMDVDSVILTYKDNEGLPQSIVDSIESRKHNKAWWTVYGLGLIGEVEGRIYTGWNVIDSIPHEARLERYGLDFGFTNDPTSIVAVYKYNGGYILDEICYRTGLLNKPIYDILSNQPFALTVADSAEPKSISELNQYGLSVVGAKKGKDSIRYGISTVQQQKISVTKRSVNILREYRSYMWETDKDGKILNVPQGFNDHCFIGSTLINTNNGLLPIKDIVVGNKVLTTNGYKKVLLKHNNGMKQVFRYRLQLDTHNDIIVSCTPTHKIKTNKGWVQISKLKSGMTVILTKSLMEKSIKYTQKKDIFQNTLQECTRLFGNTIMEKFPRGFMFITRTKTHGITQLQTLNSLLDQNTYQNIQNVELKKTQNGLLFFKKKALKEQNSGEKIIQKKQVRSTQKLLKRDGEVSVVKNLSSIVKYVLKNIRHHSHKEVNTVITTARLKHLDIEGSWKETVYDLTVENNHEYFANGLLVHNCLDAIRYAIKNLIPDDTIPKKQFSGQAILDELLMEDY